MSFCGVPSEAARSIDGFPLDWAAEVTNVFLIRHPRRVLASYAKALGKSSLKRLHCHLSGIEYSEKGEKNHLMLAESDFDLKGLVKALREYGCGGRIVCESPEMDVDALRIKAAWQKAGS